MIRGLRISVFFAYMYGFKFATRNPLTLLTLLLEPLVIPYLFFMVNSKLASTAILGSIISAIFAIGLSVAGDSTYLDYVCKFKDMLMASPMGLGNYVLGLGFSGLFFSAPVLVGLILIFWISVGTGALGVLLLLFPLLLLLFLTAICLGLLLAALVKWAYRAREIFFFIAALFTIFPAVYYPYTLLPSSFRTLSFVTPTGSIAAIMQDTMLGTSIPSWLYAVPLAYAIVFSSLIFMRGWRLLRK